MNIIYRGHNHVVECDGVWHTSISILGKKVQCRCFCKDSEYLAHGFTMELMGRYEVVRSYEADAASRHA